MTTYSRIDDEDDDPSHELLFHHPNSVLVADHHNTHVVPQLSHPAVPNSYSRPSRSFSITRRLFQTIVFQQDIKPASFSSFPAVIIADLQNGNIPAYKAQLGEQGWAIVDRKKYKGKFGIGETRQEDEEEDEELDPSDQVTCSVFVKFVSEQPKYTMAVSPLYEEVQSSKDIRSFEDPIPVSEQEFNEIVSSVRTAIENHMQPTRISQGSSGSYFCCNTAGKIVGVFKPKNEEPYGRLNPKWTKWIHRHLFPCFFGRSCLIPNLGYLSEAAASLMDRRLGTNIVPYTDVIHLSSPSFHYDYLDKKKMPPKIGSFQCFLTKYKDATVFFRDAPLVDDVTRSNSTASTWGCLGGVQEEEEEQEEQEEDQDSDHTHVASTRKNDLFRWTPTLQEQFKREFEQLVMLDYLIRNTDRGLDNWMIKHCPGHIHVAAIDNGLAFPYKHPDQWRSYPYGWMAMPDTLIRQPFSQATRDQFLPLLSDPLWWRDTIRDLRSLFEIDDDFDEKMFQKQVSVLKGQGYNIVRVLKDPHAGPLELVTMQRVVIHQEEVVIEYEENKLSSRNYQQQLRTQRSSSFDMISTVYSEDEEDQDIPPPKKKKRWQDKLKKGLHLNRRKSLFSPKRNRYRAFDSDGDLSSVASDETEDEGVETKRVTVIIESIEVVKSRTYFTCW